MPEETKESVAQEKILAELKAFVEDRFLPEGTASLETDAPLLELGILTSLNTTELIAHIQDEYQLYIPFEHIVGRNFKTLETISGLVFRLQDDPAATA